MSYRHSFSLSWLVLAIFVLFLANFQAAAAQPDVPQPALWGKEQPVSPTPISLPEKATALRELIPLDLPVLGAIQTKIETAVGPVNGEMITIDENGGVVNFLSENNLLLVNQGLLSGKQTLQIREIDLTNSVGIPDGSIFSFEITSEKSLDGTLTQPVYMAFDLRKLGMSEAEWFVLRRHDQNEPNWEYLPLTIYDATGLLSVRSDYLAGEFVLGAVVQPQEETKIQTAASGDEIDSSPAPWRYQWTLPTVSDFSGAATYNYPIEVPSGRNGLQPNIDISYSSRGVDGPITSDGLDQGALGLGWTLNNIEISRADVYDFKNGGGCERELPNSFSLVLNGQSHALIPYGSPGSYQAINNPGLRATMIQDLTATNVNSDGIYWVVQTPDGATYRLGYNDNAETGQRVDWGLLDLAGNQFEGKRGDYVGFRWRVDLVTDVYGNQVQYLYDKWPESDKDNCGDTIFHATNAQLKEIRYNFESLAPNGTTPVGGNYASRIEFALSDHRVNKINLYHNNSTVPYRVYRIGLGTEGQNNLACAHGEWEGDTDVVYFIRQESGDGYQLPTTSFHYIPLRHGTETKPEEKCWQFSYLQTIENGYGGKTQFNYQGDGRVEYSSNIPKYGQSYFVTSVYAWDGRHGDVPTVVDYEYTAPCYNQATGNVGILPQAFNCPMPNQWYKEHGNLVGFREVTQTSYEYGTSAQIRGSVIKRSKTTFSQNPATDLGRPFEQRLENANSVLLNKVLSSYLTETVNGVPNAFTYMRAQQSYTYHNGEQSSFLTTLTEYGYYPQLSSTVYQKDAAGNPVQLGQLTHITEYKDGVPYRLTRNWYQLNNQNGKWMIRPTSSALYDGNSWNMVSATWNYYDGSTAPGVLPASGKGAVTRVRQAWEIPCNQIPAGEPGGCAKAYQTIDSGYTFDAYGNTKTTTTYQNYGYRAVDSSPAEIYNLFAENAPGAIAQPTSIAYDSQYHLYPVSTTNPLGQATLFEVYGFNGVPVDGFQKQTGLLKKVTPPNGVASIYEYDPFGRLWATYDSEASRGDIATRGDGDPVSLIRYWDNDWNYSGVTYLNPAGNAPFLIAEQKRPGSFPAPANSSTGFAFNDQTFYDGFGRPIQTRSIWHWVEGQSKSREIISSTDYNALGQTICQSTPFDVAFSGDRVTWPASAYVNQNCASLARTTTTYDALGRPSIITAPDGSQTKYYYAIGSDETPGKLHSRISIVDSNNHAVTQGMNALGQLAYVQQYNGTSSYTPDGLTKYTYDILGNLQTVTDAANNVTTMTYDKLGRKTGMVDPDMGSWSYQYNAAGNLMRQEANVITPDARVLCFAYDKLNRLTQKAGYMANSACANPLPSSGSNHLTTQIYDRYSRQDTFDGSSLPSGWSGSGSSVSGGQAHVTGSGTNYGSNIRRTEAIQDGKGTRVSFSANSANAVGTIYLDSGSWGQADYRRWGLHINGGFIRVSNYQGTSQETWVLLPFQANTWYEADLLIDGNNQFRVMVWQRDNPALANGATTGAKDASWRNLNWTMTSQVHTGTFNYDTYREFNSADIGQLAQTSWGSNPNLNKETFHYDAMGRLTTDNRWIDNRQYTMGYSNFDALNRPRTITYPNGEAVTMTYDREGENSLKAGNDWLVNDIRYNTRGQITNLDRAGSIADTTYLYHPQMDITGGDVGDSNFRLQTIQHGSYGYGDNKPDFNFRYDRTGQISQLITMYNDGPNLSNIQDFTYDHLNRLLTANGTGSIINAKYSHSYAYDKLGNIITFGAGSSYDYANWSTNCTAPIPTKSMPHAVKTIGGQYFCYDNNGNMTKRHDGVNTYTQNFDVENRLTSVVVNGQTTGFAYDAGGQRVKTVKPEGVIVYTPFPNYEESLLPKPVVNMTVNGQLSLEIAPDTEFTLAWNSTYADSCRGSWTTEVLEAQGARVIRASEPGDYLYTITCDGVNGSSSTGVGVKVTARPIIDTFTSDKLVIKPNDLFTLSWSTVSAQSCTIASSSGDIEIVDINGSLTKSINNTQTFTLTCSNVVGSNAKSVTVTVKNEKSGTDDDTVVAAVDDGTPVPADLKRTGHLSRMDNRVMTQTNGGYAVVQSSTYALAGQTIAVRVSGDPHSTNNGLYYLYSDHLGSTSLLANSSNNPVTGSRTWYLPFGGYRPGSAPTQTITDRDFTGQKENMELGLLYYGARFYVPGIGRFASADTIVPNPTNPQSLNRYSYVRNSPLNMTDPTGHREAECASYICFSPSGGHHSNNPMPAIPDLPMVTFGIVPGCTSTIVGACSWSQGEIDTILASATVTGTALAGTLNAAHGWNLSASDAFLLVYSGSVNFQKTGTACDGGCWGRSMGRNSIEVFTNIIDDDGVNRLVGDVHWAVHELGHSYVSAVGSFGVGEQRFTLPSLLETVQGLNTGFPDRLSGSDRQISWGFAGGRWAWQRSSNGAASEEFADMYLGWVYNQWQMRGTALSPAGQMRSDFMNGVMPFTVDVAISH